MTIRYDVGFKNESTHTIVYPYGTININSDGYSDKEYLKEKFKLQIAYAGDSVCYGVG